MIINFMSSGTSSDQDMKLVKYFIEGMCEEYRIRFNDVQQTIMARHCTELCDWINKTHRIEASPVKLGNLCEGIRLTECAELTAAMLKI